MPPLPFVPGVMRVAYEGHIGTHDWVNVFHARFDDIGPMAVGDAALFAEAFEAAWSDVKGTIPNEVSLDRVVVDDLTNDTGDRAIQSSTQVGTNGAGSLAPISCGPLINWAISRRYRGGHPRTYSPGVLESAVDEFGVLDASYRAGVTSQWRAWKTAVESATVFGPVPIKLACVHYMKNNALQAVPTVDNLGDPQCSAIIGTQRRRVRR